MPLLFPNTMRSDSRLMLFVDGENLAVRYGKILEQGGRPPRDDVCHEPNVYVWSRQLNNHCARFRLVRRHYYTSVQGDQDHVGQIADELKAAGIERPMVFKKTKGRSSKRVDISLATDMLIHATRNNYDIAVLVAGDEDYVPLVEAVKSEGRMVVVWFLESGISRALRLSADYYADIGKVLFAPEP